MHDLVFLFSFSISSCFLNLFIFFSFIGSYTQIQYSFHRFNLKFLISFKYKWTSIMNLTGLYSLQTKKLSPILLFSGGLQIFVSFHFHEFPQIMATFWCGDFSFFQLPFQGICFFWIEFGCAFNDGFKFFLSYSFLEATKDLFCLFLHNGSFSVDVVA